MRSNALKAVRSRRWPVALVLSAVALGLTTGPAGAVGPESGEAAGVGTESLTAAGELPPTCLDAKAGAFYKIDSPVGTVTANDSLVRYQGPVTITLTVPGVHYLNPAGVFSDAACTNPNVSGTIKVESTGSTAVSSCGTAAGAATYNRVGTAVVWRGTGNCTVNGAQAGAGTLHTFTGDLIPCSPIPGEDPVTCGPAQIQGVYAETL